MPKPPNANAQPNKLTPKYRWNATAQRYIAANGTFVEQQKVVRILERQRERSRQAVTSLSRQLQAGEISLQEWRDGMLREVKIVHVASAAAAKGGWAQMSPADYGRVGGKLQYQYEKLNRMATEVQYGKQKLDGRFLQRATMYVNSSRGTYWKTVGEEKEERGMTEERNRLGAADHCSGKPNGCIEQTGRGWVTIGTLVPIGERICLSN